MLIWSVACNGAVLMPGGTSSSSACSMVTTWSGCKRSIASRAVMIFVVLHRGTRRCPCTFSKMRPEVASSTYAEEPFTRGGGVGEGEGVGVGIGVSVGVGISVGVAVGGATEPSAACQKERTDGKKVPSTTTSTTISTRTIIKSVRCFMLLSILLKKIGVSRCLWTGRVMVREDQGRPWSSLKQGSALEGQTAPCSGRPF